MNLKEKVELVLEDVRQGIPVVILDAEWREGEGDWFVAAEKITQEQIAFCMLHVRGIFCLSAAKSVFDRVGIKRAESNNRDAFCTPFTVTFDAVDNITTGVSAADKLETIKVLLDDKSGPSDLATPGHMQGLCVNKYLLKAREGHSEQSVQLAVMAGLKPIGIICEMVNEDGTMKKGQQILDWAAQYNFKTVTTEELTRYCVDVDVWPTAE